MKKIILFWLILVMSVCSQNFVEAKSNIAVVDVAVVVSESSQVQALKREYNEKIKELDKWLKIVRADINKQKTNEGKEKLIKKYDEEYVKRKNEIAKSYQNKIKSIDKNISDVIAKEAKSHGYDIVLSKQNAVLYGGDDITENIKKLVK